MKRLEMISKGEIKTFLRLNPPGEGLMCSLLAGTRLPKAMVKETREVVALARKFNRQVVIPKALDLDLKLQFDPEYLAWEFVKEANAWGFYTMWIPRVFGGKGYNMPSMAYFLEELASGCLAMANLIGVHYLGVSTLCATWNLRLINRLCRDVADGERKGRPRLISLAITEPDAGTDVEEVDLLDRAVISSRLRKVEGGYRLNGTKVFISNGHLSSWHLIVAYEDHKRPSENMVVMAIETGTRGFSFGRTERKMGQKACPASQLLFTDCFVPDDQVCVTAEQMRNSKRDFKGTLMQFLDYVLSVTRAGVGAFGTGVARGALEDALRFAENTSLQGKPLAHYEWVQCLLAEMYKNVAISRLTYEEANYANGLYGFFRLLQNPIIYYGIRIIPEIVIRRMLAPLMDRKALTRLLRKVQMEGQSEIERKRTSGLASLAKFAATDAGIRNCRMALDLMGVAGLRQDQGTEKRLRDAKLLQIYEGTNQLNRLNLFKCLVAGKGQGVGMFED